MVKNKYKIEVGRAYRWTKDGPTFLCIDYDLETFTGVCIEPGTVEPLKLGKVQDDLNADGTEWYRLRGKIQIPESPTVLTCTTFKPGKKPKTKIVK